MFGQRAEDRSNRVADGMQAGTEDISPSVPLAQPDDGGRRRGSPAPGAEEGVAREDGQLTLVGAAERETAPPEFVRERLAGLIAEVSQALKNPAGKARVGLQHPLARGHVLAEQKRIASSRARQVRCGRSGLHRRGGTGDHDGRGAFAGAGGLGG